MLSYRIYTWTPTRKCCWCCVLAADSAPFLRREWSVLTLILLESFLLWMLQRSWKLCGLHRQYLFLMIFFPKKLIILSTSKRTTTSTLRDPATKCTTCQNVFIWFCRQQYTLEDPGSDLMSFFVWRLREDFCCRVISSINSSLLIGRGDVHSPGEGLSSPFAIHSLIFKCCVEKW